VEILGARPPPSRGAGGRKNLTVRSGAHPVVSTCEHSRDLPRLDGQILPTISQFGWLVTHDYVRAGPSVAQGAKTLRPRQTAFDAEVAAIEAALTWYHRSPFRHLVIHSDSTSAIARAGHSGVAQDKSAR
jgi:hypothetical protein